MPHDALFDLERLPDLLEAPVLIVSTVVGRGMYTLGHALQERLAPLAPVEHAAIEDVLPPAAVAEDLRRYKWISNYAPFLLNLMYRVPIFYYRKYLRESLRGGTELPLLRQRLGTLRPKTVLCVSHRPAFWISGFKKRAGMDFKLWGVLGEYGNTLGWRYLFWEQMNGFLSPVPRDDLSYAFPPHLDFRQIDLPARREYHELASVPADPDCVLLVCGYWGQGPIQRVVHKLLAGDAGLKVHVVCGENADAFREARAAFADRPNVHVHGAVESLAPFLREAACVVTKPGISTLLEAHAAGRKIFLLRGMPVAEDNNAQYAVEHFDAEWFSAERFQKWRQTQGVPHGLGERGARV